MYMWCIHRSKIQMKWDGKWPECVNEMKNGKTHSNVPNCRTVSLFVLFFCLEKLSAGWKSASEENIERVIKSGPFAVFVITTVCVYAFYKSNLIAFSTFNGTNRTTEIGKGRLMSIPGIIDNWETVIIAQVTLSAQ